MTVRPAHQVLIDHVSENSPEWASPICDVPARTIRRIANDFLAEARGGETLLPNHVWVAPGNFHMRVRRNGAAVKIVLDQRELICGTRPAADALFPTGGDSADCATEKIV